MIKEALAWLEANVKQAQNVQPIITSDYTTDRFSIAGEVHEFDVPPPARAHAFNDLDDLLAFVDGYPLSESDEPAVVIWFSAGRIVAVLDNESYRRNTAHMNIEPTDEWTTVENLKEWLDQKAFIRLLRFDLGSVLPPSALLDKVRKIRFENGVVTSQVTQKDRESMGREITSRLTAETELPEEILVSLQPAVIPGLEAREYVIRLVLEVDSARGMFRLLPAPGELERAERQWVRHLGRHMRETLPNIPVYNGRPEA
jgi:hypothetical protein